MKAAIYCRLSEEDRNKKDEKDESNSIRNQKAMLLQYAMDRDWEVYNIYSDDDYTGSDRRRPEFNRLLSDAEARRFDIILCKTQSRFTRELELVEKYIHGLFPLWGIRFVGVVDNADTANRGNKKSRQINGLVNEWYLEDMSENIRSVLDSRRKNGCHIGSFALYGYKKDPERKGGLITDPAAAEVVREVFSMFDRGFGKEAIARCLNSREIPSPAKYKRRQGLKYGSGAADSGSLWRYSTISDMLTNEMYIGNMVQGRYGSISYKTKQNRPRPKESWYIVENTHEAIIDRELWERVQERIRARSKPRKDGKPGIFAGKVICAYCKRIMRSHVSRGRYYLKCSTKNISEAACTGSFIPQKYLENKLIEEIRRLNALYLDTDRLERSVERADDLSCRKRELERRLEKHRKRLAQLSKGLKDLYMDKTSGVISEDDFSFLIVDLNKDRSNTARSIDEIQERIKQIDECARAGDNRRERIKKYTDPGFLRREVVEALTDHIEAGRRIQGTKDYPVEIYWNF